MSDMSLINLTTRVSSEEATVETLDAGPQPVTTKLGEKMSSGCDKKIPRTVFFSLDKNKPSWKVCVF